MSDERDETAEAEGQPVAAATPAEASDERAPAAGERSARTSDDFLVPGPSPQSNEGLARWGCTWLAFSLLLILLMLGLSFVCLTLANWTGVA